MPSFSFGRDSSIVCFILKNCQYEAVANTDISSKKKKLRHTVGYCAVETYYVEKLSNSIINTFRSNQTQSLQQLASACLDKMENAANTCTALERTLLVSVGSTIPSQRVLAAAQAALPAANSNSLAVFLRGLAPPASVGWLMSGDSPVLSAWRILVHDPSVNGCSSHQYLKENLGFNLG
jgi:hypothetical protein